MWDSNSSFIRVEKRVARVNWCPLWRFSKWFQMNNLNKPLCIHTYTTLSIRHIEKDYRTLLGSSKIYLVCLYKCYASSFIYWRKSRRKSWRKVSFFSEYVRIFMDFKISDFLKILEIVSNFRSGNESKIKLKMRKF